MAQKPTLKKAVRNVAISLHYQAQHIRSLGETDSEKIARRLIRLRDGLVRYQAGGDGTDKFS